MSDTALATPVAAPTVVPAIDAAPAPVAVAEATEQPKKKLAEMASWDELTTAPEPAPVAEDAPTAPITREDGASWDSAKGQWRRPDGTFAEGAAPEVPAPAPAGAPAEDAPVEEPKPAEKIALRTRDGGTREIEVDDPELAEILRTNANDGMRANQYREKVAALDAKLAEVNTFRAMMDANPEAVVLQHLPADSQVSIAVSLIAQHWDQIVPTIMALNENPSERIATAMKAQASIRENTEKFNQQRETANYATSVSKAVHALIPDGVDDATAERFLSYAGHDLATHITKSGPVDPAQVPALLAETAKLFGFTSTAATPPAAPRVRFASAPPSPAPTDATAARPVGDAAVALAEKAKQAAARTRDTQAARARAAAVPPSGAGAAPVRMPPVPKGADIRTASKALKEMGNSWGHFGGS